MRSQIIAIFMALTSHVYAEEGAQPNPRREQAPSTSQQQSSAPVEGEVTTRQADTSKNEERELRDLKAQESMAFWAAAMFWATIGTVVVAGIGLIYIRKTLLETRRIGQAETRAYLSIKSGKYDAAGGWLWLEVEIENFGNSPARNVTVCPTFSANLPKESSGNIPQTERVTYTHAATPVGDIQARGSLIAIDLDWESGNDVRWDRLLGSITAGGAFRLKLALDWIDVFDVKCHANFGFACKSGSEEFDEDSGLVTISGKLQDDGRSYEPAT